MSAMWIYVSGAQYSFSRSNKFLFLVAWSRGSHFEENPKSVQDVIGDLNCPGEFCSNRENCKSIGGYVTTPTSIFACDNCGAWLFVQKVPFKLQEHVKTTKTDKTRFFFAKKRCYPTNNCSLVSHFNQPKMQKKELCVDNKVREIIGDVYCPTCRNEKCLYISTKETTSF